MGMNDFLEVMLSLEDTRYVQIDRLMELAPRQRGTSVGSGLVWVDVTSAYAPAVTVGKSAQGSIWEHPETEFRTKQHRERHAAGADCWLHL